MTIQHKVFAAESQAIAADVNNYLMNQTVVTVNSESELGSIPTGVHSAYVTATGYVYVKGTDNLWRAQSQSTGWNRVETSATDYDQPLTAGAAAMILPGTQHTVTVPTNRVMDVEFRAGIGHVAGGFMHVRLYINGVEEDALTIGGDNNVWAPIFLAGSTVGTGAAIDVHVTGELQAGSVSGEVRTTPNAHYGVTMRYKIW